MIIETSDNRLFRVRETGNPNLAHVWMGVEVKRSAGTYIPKAKARETLVRKAASRLIDPETSPADAAAAYARMATPAQIHQRRIGA